MCEDARDIELKTDLGITAKRRLLMLALIDMDTEIQAIKQIVWNPFILLLELKVSE